MSPHASVHATDQSQRSGWASSSRGYVKLQHCQGRSEEFHLGGGYKFQLVIPISKSKHVNVPHVNKTASKLLTKAKVRLFIICKVDWFWGYIYTDILPRRYAPEHCTGFKMLYHWASKKENTRSVLSEMRIWRALILSQRGFHFHSCSSPLLLHSHPSLMTL